jgi:4-hydroxyphenylpyruvate dioxygenase
MGSGAASGPVATAQQHASATATDAPAAPPAAKPAVHAPKQLVGYDNFKRSNPRSDRFTVHRFHHIEFWCGDATNTYKR